MRQGQRRVHAAERAAVMCQGLRRVERADELPLCCHCTFERLLSPILREGLRCMAHRGGAEHIYFSTTAPASEGHGVVLRGEREVRDVVICVDVARAMEEHGIEFYRVLGSDHIVSCGDAAGVLPVSCFTDVVRCASGERVPLPRSAGARTPQTVPGTEPEQTHSGSGAAQTPSRLGAVSSQPLVVWRDAPAAHSKTHHVRVVAALREARPTSRAPHLPAWAS